MDMDLDGTDAAENKIHHNAVAQSIISGELHRLSYSDRNEIQEEIHGVGCMTVEETPELLERVLHAFQYQLALVAPSKKGAYNKILELKQQKQMWEGAISSNNKTETVIATAKYALPQQHPSFIESDDFRLRFLRCELFDVEKAVIRFFNYLNLAYELFGEVALRRPIRVDDFTRQEFRLLKKGYLQLFPYRDRAGRRVMVIVGSKNPIDMLPWAKVYFYIRDVATRDSVESQRKGTVLFVDSSAWDLNSRGSSGGFLFSPYAYTTIRKVIASVPTRMAAIHYCFPNTALFNIVRFVTDFNNPYLVRVRIHTGNKIEIRYKMKGYGIPINLLPLTETGSIKVKTFHEWLKLRSVLEEEENSNAAVTISGDDSDRGRSDLSRVVECPAFNDVVFRQGTPSIKNRGNTIFRDKMIAHLEEYYNQWQISGGHHQQQEQIEQFCEWLIQDTEVHRKGQFLEWSKQWNTWVKMIDRDRIKTKVWVSYRDTTKRFVNVRKQMLSSQATAAAAAPTAMEGLTVEQGKIDSDENEKSYAFVEGGRGATQRMRCLSSSSSSPKLIDGISLRSDSKSNETDSCWL